jgi:16S rRNA (cytosine1402-N4)-methyltransferase
MNINEICDENSEYLINIHKSVLLKKVLEYLNPQPNQNFVDCTIGQGGHAFAILEGIKPGGKVLGIEADPELYRELKFRIKKLGSKVRNNLILVNDSYVNLN